MPGYIKLYRSLIDWEWYQDPNTMRVFLHLLLDANHKPKRWQGITINQGQTVTSRKRLSNELHLSEQMIRTALNNLKSTSEITIKSTSRYSLVTIVKWASYQSDEVESTSQTPVKQPAINQQSTTNKNDKNDKKNTYGQFAMFWGLYPKKVNKALAQKSFEKLNPSDDLFQTIIEKLNKQKQSPSWLKDNGQFVPHPTTWLNNRRWEDEDGEQPKQLYPCID